jgi:hypothetical protein
MQKRLVVNSAKILSNKTKATAIAIFLILTITATLVALPVNAHTPPWTLSTWCYVTVENNPIGVNQQTLIVFWDNEIPPGAQGAYGDRWTFTLDITKPDGSNETLGPFTSDPVGGGYTSYTPTQVGSYTVVAKFAEHKITGLPLNPAGGQTLTYVNDTFSAETSEPATFIVQQEPVKPWQEPPLPTQFWTLPINSANRNWHVLAGNWLAGAAQNVGPTTGFGYGTGPESAHVLWATPMWAGGIMDARFGDIGYETGHYEGLNFLPSIILNGKIYYNVNTLPKEGWYCLDLYTGQTEYFYNTTGPVTGVSQSSSGSIAGDSLAFGQILNFECPNQHGGFPYLWSTSGYQGTNTWDMFDAVTGNYMCSIANVSASGTQVYGKDGSILYYNIVGTGANKRLTVWNTTQAIWWKPTFVSNDYWLWRPGLNVTYDGRNGFSLNASIPNVQGSILAVREDEYVIGGTTGKNNGTYVLQGNLWALNLKPASDGTITPTLLWNITFTPPLQTADDNSAALQSAGLITMGTVDPEDGVFLFSEKATRQWWGYSLTTGQPLWGPTASEPAMGYYYILADIYQGELLTYGSSGVLTARNITTGNILWNYTATNVGFESPYGGNYPIGISCIADGKIYTVSGEHSPTQPLWRGPNLRCINASNGVELWKILFWGSRMMPTPGNCYVYIADGIVIGLNFYDTQIYAFGKGPSATTVSASPKIAVSGNGVMLEGTVTDIAAGTKQLAQAADFPNGVPAVSDASQEAWMEYLYEQQARPSNATGVPVTLDAIDPNGNFIHIGDATSDLSGAYSYTWTTPDVPGKYTITATFAGSAAYYSSYAETATSVSEAPPATAPPEYPQPIDNTWTIVGVGIAIMIVVAIVGILLYRKRP